MSDSDNKKEAVRNWLVRVDGVQEESIREEEVRALLKSENLDDRIEFRQGAGQWFPAQEVKRLYEQLGKEGYYLNDGDHVHGPYVRWKLKELFATGYFSPGCALVRKGLDGRWSSYADFESDGRSEEITLGNEEVNAQSPASDSPKGPTLVDDPQGSLTPDRPETFGAEGVMRPEVSDDSHKMSAGNLNQGAFLKSLANPPEGNILDDKRPVDQDSTRSELETLRVGADDEVDDPRRNSSNTGLSLLHTETILSHHGDVDYREKSEPQDDRTVSQSVDATGGTEHLRAGGASKGEVTGHRPQVHLESTSNQIADQIADQSFPAAVASPQRRVKHKTGAIKGNLCLDCGRRIDPKTGRCVHCSEDEEVKADSSRLNQSNNQRLMKQFWDVSQTIAGRLIAIAAAFITSAYFFSQGTVLVITWRGLHTFDQQLYGAVCLALSAILFWVGIFTTNHGLDGETKLAKQLAKKVGLGAFCVVSLLAYVVQTHSLRAANAELRVQTLEWKKLMEAGGYRQDMSTQIDLGESQESGQQTELDETFYERGYDTPDPN